METQYPASSIGRDFPPAYGYQRTESDSRRGFFDMHGTNFELSPLKSVGIDDDERELPPREA